MRALIFTSLLFLFLFTEVFSQHTENSNLSLQGKGIQFVENKGQLINMNGKLIPEVLFSGEAGNLDIYLRKEGFSYVIVQTEEPADSRMNVKQITVSTPEKSGSKKVAIKLQRIDVDFLGCNKDRKVLTSQQTANYFNYYLGHCPQGITNVPAYNKVIYENIYNNIDIIFYGGTNGSEDLNTSAGLKYDIVVKPGGNPNDIRIKYTGADKIFIENNELKVESSLGDVRESIPRVYQNVEGKIVDVAAAYELQGSTLNFKLKAFNSKIPLVIDPWITYFGGNDGEKSHSITVDKNGNTVITGDIFGTNFPATVGVFQTVSGGGFDAYAAKFDANGNNTWATYFGGNAVDYGFGVVTDSNNEIIITGETVSPDLPFTTGAFQTVLRNTGTGGGWSDAFIAKFTTAGMRIWATYYGGDENESGVSIACDANNNTVITGATNSYSFPCTVGAFQTATGGGVCCHGMGTSYDVLVVKLDPNGNPVFSTYYGGDQTDAGYSVAVDKLGDVVVTGITCGNFPLGTTPSQPVFGGGLADIFVLKLTSLGAQSWATYYGGNDWEAGYGIDTDSNNDILVIGYTFSNNFPTSPGASQAAFGGGVNDGYVLKLNSTGNRIWSTLYGRAPYDEWFLFCTVDDKDNIFVLGEWEESNLNPNIVFTCGYQKTFGGFEDQFIVKFDSSGALQCNTFLGGPGEDDLDNQGGGIAYQKGFIYVTLMANAPGYPVTPGCYQPNYGGNGDVIIAKICGSNCGDPATISNVDFTWPSTVCSSTGINFTNLLANANLCDTVELHYEWTFTGATVATSTMRNPSGIVFPANGTFPVKMVIVNPCGRDSITKNVTVSASPTAAISGSVTVCAGTATVLTASGGTSYTWSTTGITTSTISSAPTSNTTYTLIATAGSCSDTTTHTISLQTLPVASITGNTVVCSGDIISLTATGGSSYYWNTTATTSVLNSPSTGISSFTVIVSNTAACKDTASINITINPLPLISFTGNNSICIGDSAMITAAGGSSYSWSAGSNTANATLHPTSTGSSIYNLTVTGANGCVKDSAVIITVNSMPIANAGLDDTICSGEIATLIASGGGTYSWNNGPSAASQNISPPITTSYTVIVANGNCTDLDSAKVVVNLAPIANAGNNVNILPGQSTTLSASGGGTYYWSPSTGLDCSTCAQPVARPSQTTKYYVTVTDANGCTSMDSVLVTVDILCKDFFIPNVFSPNDDGQNDVFRIYGTCIKSAHLVIYDRWGEKVFETNNVTEGWNGIYKGKLMDAAVFTYIFTAALDNGESINTKGNVTLLK